MTRFIITNEPQMMEFGAALAELLAGRGAVYISGNLGAGKTTLCRGILRAMGYQGAVKSPTFTLVEPYSFANGEVFHFDLYRLASPDELEYIGIDDYFLANSLCLVEWPEKAEGFLPEQDLDISIDVAGEKRNIDIQGKTSCGEKVCEALKSRFN